MIKKASQKEVRDLAREMVKEALKEHLEQVDQVNAKVLADIEKLRDGALEKLLDEVREQAKERDLTLYRRIEELGATASDRIKAEKEKMLQAFKDMTRIMDERDQAITDLDEKVRRRLITYDKAQQALLREFEALKAGVRIGEGE